MKKKLFILVAVLPFCMNILAQNDEAIEYLKNLINTSKQDTEIIHAYVDWGMELYMYNPDTALILWLQAKEMAEKKLSDPLPKDIDDALNDHLASALNNIGSIYDNRGNKDSALEYYTKSLRISEKISDSSSIAGTLGNIGYVHSSQGNKSKALEYYLKSLEISEKINDKGEMIYSLNNIGFVYQHQGNNLKAIEYYKQALKISEEIKDDDGIALLLNNIAYTYGKFGDIPKALNYYARSLKKKEEIGDIYGIAVTYNNIAFEYQNQEDNDKALEYYNKAVIYFEKCDNAIGVATAYSNVGVIYQNEADNFLVVKNFSKADSVLNHAYKYYKKALKIRNEIGDMDGIAASMINIGNVHYRQADYNNSIKDSLINEAYQCFLKSYEINKEIGNKAEMVYSLYNLAAISRELNSLVLFNKYATQSYTLSKELGYPIDIERAASMMKEVSVKQGNYKKAYEYYLEEITMRDSILSEKNYKETQKQLAQYEYEKQAAVDSIAHVKEIELKDIDIARIEEEKRAQAAQRNMFIVGFALVLVLAVYIFRSYRQKKKANILLAERNEEIMQQKEEIITQNDHILQQKEEIESQRDLVINQKEHIEKIHHEVSQSIDYATRLQSSILPEESVLKNNISDHFVLFKPKDKVSGDFYWWAKVEDHIIITAADCTGHGVPGAFMSMLGVSFLREIVLKEYITHPGVILRKLRKEIIKTLKQKGDIGSQKDGMDMALISIDLKTNLCQFAGANNPLYLIMNDPKNDRISDLEKNSSIKVFNNSLVEIKGDKMPIAIYEKMDSYLTHEIQLSTGDALYIFSDGYADQFGGSKGKKYKYKPFKQLLTDHSTKTMNEQKILLDNNFISWKGEYEQIDDVVVIGIKI